MTEKEKKELFKQFNIELCELCKEGRDESRVRYLIGTGADIFYQGLKPLSNAVRKKNFALINVLIEAGILTDHRAARLVGSICDYRNFDDETEAKFFVLLDKCIAVTGVNPEYFVPYINCMLIHGKTDKMYRFMNRYNIDRSQAAAAIFPRMIFETINNGHYNSLEFINENIDWMTQANLDNAVASGETDVVKYIFDNSELSLPSEPAIMSALFEGSTEILSLLIEKGWNPSNNPLYLKKACRSFFSNGERALTFLLRQGYTLTDSYDGKTIYENALTDGNTPLIRYLEKTLLYA